MGRPISIYRYHCAPSGIIVPLREYPLYLAVTLPVYPNGQLCPFGNSRYIYLDNLYLAGGYIQPDNLYLAGRLYLAGYMCAPSGIAVIFSCYITVIFQRTIVSLRA